MATTTATISLSSADLTGDALALSTTSTLTKQNSLTGLTQFTGVGRKTRSSQAALTLFDGDAYANGSHKVYLRNTSTVATEYFTIEINSEQMGKLYAGDWAFFPWEANADTNDIKIAASVDTAMTIEYALFIDE